MHKHFIIAIALATVCFSCATRDLTTDARYNRHNLTKDSVLVLSQACSLIHYRGFSELAPVEPTGLSASQKEWKVSVIGSGTRVRFLGIREETVYTAPTRVTSSGRIMDGEFKGRKVDIGRLLNDETSYSVAKK